MVGPELRAVSVSQKRIFSTYLSRYVVADFYSPSALHSGDSHLLLINDGQDLQTMKFEAILERLTNPGHLQPLVCVGIHAGENRRVEYGTASVTDYLGRGAKAADYAHFIVQELLPILATEYPLLTFKSRSVAGFSLGGLSAIDLVWEHPELFSTAGVFSGSLWWRTKDLTDGYQEDRDRIMHSKIANGRYQAGLKFYFSTGSLDELSDRNNNGIIDSIDDTLAILEELKRKGYDLTDLAYINYEDGRHDVETWGRALPAFLLWRWGVQVVPGEPVFESC
ncbi:MAG: alpha/beta hydrolase-fold protein [Chitinophagaceae bacterium]